VTWNGRCATCGMTSDDRRNQGVIYMPQHQTNEYDRRQNGPLRTVPLRNINRGVSMPTVRARARNVATFHNYSWHSGVDCRIRRTKCHIPPDFICRPDLSGCHTRSRNWVGSNGNNHNCADATFLAKTPTPTSRRITVYGGEFSAVAWEGYSGPR